MSIYFSKVDPLGGESTIHRNYENHKNRKSAKQDYAWGSDEHARKLFPRGKAFGKLFSIQFDGYAKNICWE